MKRTTAPGSAAGLYVDDNPALGVVGTLLVAEDRNGTQEELCGPIEGMGLTLSGADSTQLWKAIRKAIKERGREVGEVFSLMDRKPAVAWSESTPDTYFPAICLSAIATYLDVATANYPDLVAYLRAAKLTFKAGLTGEIADPVVTNWAIAANVGTLTFQNDADHIAFLTALLEDELVHGSYTNWRSITLAANIGNITAGTYAITNVNAASRTVSFAFSAVNASGAVTSSASFYSHRVAGSTTTARLFEVKGRSLVSANDGEGVAGLRHRDRMQGHWHNFRWTSNGTPVGSVNTFASSAGSRGVAAATATAYDAINIDSPITDGANGTPRTGPTTDPRALSVHFYIHAGRAIA